MREILKWLLFFFILIALLVVVVVVVVYQLLLALPYLYYNVRLYTRKQHLVDVTEIFNQLHWEKKQRFFKLGYLIFLLCVTVFWMIYNALEDDEM